MAEAKGKKAPCFENGVPTVPARRCGAITTLKRAPGPNQPATAEYHVDKRQCRIRRAWRTGLTCPAGIAPDRPISTR
ncbi:MAG: hypothetical protein ABH867_00690 [Patescibacteria group bacterium]|nr:hypothetical protein [Patescibacteria group bacterium]